MRSRAQAGACLHDSHERLYALRRHGVVDGGSDATNGAVPLKLHQAALLANLEKGLLQLGRRHREGDVHQAADIGGDGALVEAVRGGDRVVDLGRLLLVALLHGLQPAQAEEALEDEATLGRADK